MMQYEQPKLEVIMMEEADVITVSSAGVNTETGWGPLI